MVSCFVDASPRVRAVKGIDVALCVLQHIGFKLVVSLQHRVAVSKEGMLCALHTVAVQHRSCYLQELIKHYVMALSAYQGHSKVTAGSMICHGTCGNYYLACPAQVAVSANSEHSSRVSMRMVAPAPAVLVR